MKRKIDPLEYAGDVIKALSTGILLTTKGQNKINTMTIGWGTIGMEWGKRMFTVFVRENRFTRQLLDETSEFTINVPYVPFSKNILGICGTKSGRDTDKIKELGLTLEEPESISVPGIRELPLTFECKVLYKQLQDRRQVPKEAVEQFYPPDVDSFFHGENKDYHIAYYGEIVQAYIIEP